MTARQAQLPCEHLSTTPLQLSCQGSDGQPATIGSSANAAPPTGNGAVLGGALGGAAVGVWVWALRR